MFLLYFPQDGVHLLSCLLVFHTDRSRSLDRWHATILSHLSFIPLTTINAYTKTPPSSAITANSNEAEEFLYHDGDLVAHFVGCHKDGGGEGDAGGSPGCLQEMMDFRQKMLNSHNDVNVENIRTEEVLQGMEAPAAAAAA